MTTYSSTTHKADGSKAAFSVGFDYLKQAHVSVTVDAVTKTDGTDYDWSGDKEITFRAGKIPASGTTVVIKRDTPESDQIVQWKDGSYIIAEDLNESDLQWLYNIQELTDNFNSLETTAIKYKGAIDLTTDAPPASPEGGDFYINTGEGKVLAAYAGIAGDDVVGSEQVVYSETDSEWQIFKVPSSQQGVIEVKVAVPITRDVTDPQRPIIGVTKATTTADGVMSKEDKTKLDGINTGAGGIITDAPNDGNQYARQSRAWAQVNIPPGTVIAATAPATADAGQLWYNTTDNRLYIATDDTPTWVETSPNAAALWSRTGTTLSPANAGDKATSGATVAGDPDATLTTKGYVDTAVSGVDVGVTKLVAGSNITLSPTSGTGQVTVSSTGGGGGGGTTINYSGAAAWGDVASDGTLNAGLNVASVTRTSTGIYSVVFTTAMPNANYSVTADQDQWGFTSVSAKTANGFTVATGEIAGPGNSDRNFSFAVHALNALPPRGGTGADAWGRISATGDRLSDFNVASVSREGLGKYAVTFTTPMPDNQYAVDATVFRGVSNEGWATPLVGVYNITANGFNIDCRDGSGNPVDRGISFLVHATNAQLPDTVTQEQIEAAINNPGVSAWGVSNGRIDNGAAPIESSLNVKSITRQSEGAYDVIFATPMPSADYSLVGGVTSSAHNAKVSFDNVSASSFTLRITDSDGALKDTRFSFTVFATNALPPKGGTGADAWVEVDADGTNGASFNIGTVTKSATGTYEVSFATPMPTADYSVTFGRRFVSGFQAIQPAVDSQTTSGFTVLCESASSGTLSDYPFNAVVHATNAQLPDTVTQEQLDTVLKSGPLAGLRNQLINGSFDIWQRGISHTGANTSYTADRWVATTANPTNSVSRTTGNFGQFTYAARIQNAEIKQGVELPASGEAGAFAPGTTWTASLYTDNPTPGFSCYFTDSVQFAGNDVTVHTGSMVATGETAGGLNRFSITFTISAAPNATNDSLLFHTTGFTSGTFTIAGCQLEPGPNATSFEQRPVGMELSLCQRYYYRHNFTGNITGGFGCLYSTTAGRVWNQFPVTMRDSPFLTVEDLTYDIVGVGSVTATSNVNEVVSTTGATWDGTGLSPTGTFGGPFAYAGRWNVSAEL